MASEEKTIKTWNTSTLNGIPITMFFIPDKNRTLDVHPGDPPPGYEYYQSNFEINDHRSTYYLLPARQGTNPGAGETNLCTGMAVYIQKYESNGHIVHQSLYMGLAHRDTTNNYPTDESQWDIGIIFPPGNIPENEWGWAGFIITDSQYYLDPNNLDIILHSHNFLDIYAAWQWGHYNSNIYPRGSSWIYVSPGVWDEKSLEDNTFFTLKEAPTHDCTDPWLGNEGDCICDSNFDKWCCECNGTCSWIKQSPSPHPDCISPPTIYELLSCDCRDYDHCFDYGSEGACVGDSACKWYSFGCGPHTEWNWHPPGRTTYQYGEIQWIYIRVDCPFATCGGFSGKYIKFELYKDGETTPSYETTWGPLGNYSGYSFNWWLWNWSGGNYTVKAYWGETSSCPNYLGSTSYTILQTTYNCYKCDNPPNPCVLHTGLPNPCDEVTTFATKTACENATNCSSQTYDCYKCDNPPGPCVLHTGLPNPCDEVTTFATKTACEAATGCSSGGAIGNIIWEESDFYEGPFPPGSHQIISHVRIINNGIEAGYIRCELWDLTPGAEDLIAPGDFYLEPGASRWWSPSNILIPDTPGSWLVGIKIWGDGELEPAWGTPDKTHQWPVQISYQPEICSWILDQVPGWPSQPVTDIPITSVMEIIDSFVLQTSPPGYTFIPTLQNVFGVIDYYLGFDGDPATGCDFFP